MNGGRSCVHKNTCAPYVRINTARPTNPLLIEPPFPLNTHPSTAHATPTNTHPPLTCPHLAATQIQLQYPSKHYKDTDELQKSLDEWLKEYSRAPLSSDESDLQTADRIFRAVRADPALLQVRMLHVLQYFIY